MESEHMKFIGRFEKKMDAAETKQKQSKNLLLQTYITSLLSMVLCMSMFLGTSYAWFTSEVTSTVNEIYVGRMEAGLYAGSVMERNLAVAGNEFLDSEIFWEPGYTALETLYVNNSGQLAFRYVVSFIDGTVEGGKSLADVAKYFDVHIISHPVGQVPTPNSYSEITNSWTPLGTLDVLLAGGTVAEGALKVEENAAYTVAIHMRENADDSLMGQRLKLNVKLVAYQETSETDDLGSSQYDAGITTAANAEDLKTALNSKKNIILLADVTLTNADSCLELQGSILDGDDNTISYTGERVNDAPVGVMVTKGGSINDLSIHAGSNGHALYANGLTSNLYVADCNLNGDNTVFVLTGGKNTANTIHFADTHFGNHAAYANAMKHAYFSKCSFGGDLIPGGDTTLTNCHFYMGLDLSKLEAGESVTLINCTFGHLTVEEAVLTARNGEIVIEGCDNLSVDENGMVVVTE